MLKEAEIEGYKFRQANYHAALPLWVNAETLPEPPEPPEWLQELMDEG